IKPLKRRICPWVSDFPGSIHAQPSKPPVARRNRRSPRRPPQGRSSCRGLPVLLFPLRREPPGEQTRREQARRAPATSAARRWALGRTFGGGFPSPPSAALGLKRLQGIHLSWSRGPAPPGAT
ncbi:hypothetical protein E2562_030282, partial [Oryza meyeriana var. granulata]